MMKTIQRVLFLPLHTPSLLEMLPIAEKLVDDGCFEPIFFISQDIPIDHLKSLIQKQIRVIGPKAETNENNVGGKPTTSEEKPTFFLPNSLKI